MKSTVLSICTPEKNCKLTQRQSHLWYSGLRTFSPFSQSLLAHSGCSENHLHSKKKPCVVYKLYKQKEPMDSKNSFCYFKLPLAHQTPYLSTHTHTPQNGTFWPWHQPCDLPLDFIHSLSKLYKKKRGKWEPTPFPKPISNPQGDRRMDKRGGRKQSADSI